MQPLIQKYLLSGIRTVAGLTVHLKTKDEWSYALVLMQRKKNQAIIVDRRENLSSLEEVKEIIGSCPLLIHVDGWGVLIRQTKGDDGSDSVNYFDGEKDEFIISPFNIEGTGFVSIIRTALLTDVIHQLQAHHFSVIGINVAPVDAATLLVQIYENGVFRAGSREITIAQHCLIKIRTVVSNQIDVVAIGDDNVPSGLLPSYAHVVNFFAGSHSNVNALQQSLFHDFLYKRLIKFILVFSLSFLFSALMFNFLFFSSLNVKVRLLSDEIEVNQALFVKLDRATKDLSRKEELVKNSGLNGHISFAWQADRLAQIMPDELILSKMAFQPLMRKLQQGREAQFEFYHVQIRGKCNQTSAIRQWMELIKKEDWVDGVEMTHFSHDKEDTYATFELDILMKP